MSVPLKFKRFYIQGSLLLAACVLLITSITNAQNEIPPNGNQPLDVILLLDSSGSTIYERDLIEKAAGFLLDFLNARSDFAQNYRLGVVGFNQDVISDSIIYLGRPSKSNLADFFASTPASGDTDFKPALEFSLEEFDRAGSLDGNSIPIIIMMTDGQPADGGEVLADLDSYFENIQQLVTEVDEAGATLFVVAVGDAVADRERWQSMLPEEQYAYVEDSSELSKVYWQFLSGFTAGDQDETIELQTGKPQIVTVEPFLDEITLSVLKNDPLANVKIVMPDGSEYAKGPAEGGGETDLHEIYVIPVPDEGKWEVTLEGEDGRLLINRRYPRVYLETANPVVPVGTDFSVYAFLDSESLTRAEPDELMLYLVNNLENYQDVKGQIPETWIPFELTKDGYEAVVSGGNKPDLYSLLPVVLYNGELVNTVEPDGITIKSVNLPHITNLEAIQELPGGPFIFKYDIENDEAIQNLVPQLEIRSNGELVGLWELEDYDATGEMTLYDDLPRPEGEYEIILRIEGITPDNLNYSDAYRITINVRPPASPTPGKSVPPIVRETPTRLSPTPTQAPPHIPAKQPFSSTLIIILLTILTTAVIVGLFLFWVYLRRNKSQPYTTNVSKTEVSEKSLDDLVETELKNLDFDGNPYIAIQQSKSQVKKTLMEADRLSSKADEYAIPILKTTLNKTWKDMYDKDTDRFFDEYFRVQIEKNDKKQHVEFLLEAVASIVHTVLEENPPHMVDIIYESILVTGKVSPSQIVEAFDSPNKEFFAEWVGAINNPCQENYKKIVKEETRHGDLSKVYALLVLLEEAGEDGQIISESQYVQLREHFTTEGDRPLSTWGRLFDDMNPLFELGQWDTRRKEAWKSFNTTVSDVQCNLKHERYANLPEVKLIQNRLAGWKKGSSTVVNNWNNTKQDADTPGQLYLQLKTSLDLYDTVEELPKLTGWTYILHGVLFHVGGDAIDSIHMKYQLENAQTRQLEIKATRLSQGEYALFSTTLSPINKKTRLTFLADYKTSAIFGRKRQDVLRTDEAIYSLNVGSDNNEYINKSLADKFVISRPLNSDEVIFFNIDYITSLIEDIQRFLVDQRGMPGVILIEGLRQTGKTTTIKQVLLRLDISSYQIVEFDLMTWWNEKMARGVQGDNVFSFWQHFLQELQDTFQPNEGVLHNGINELRREWHWAKFLEFMQSWLDVTKRQLLLVLDDADIFRKFNTEETEMLISNMIDLLDSTKSVIWTANDDRSELWRDQLEAQFRDSVRRKQPGARIKSFQTRLLNYNESCILLSRQRGLQFTNMAFLTAYAFTGGWISHLQSLGKLLVKSLNDEFAAGEHKVSGLITSGKVRMIYQEADRQWKGFETYLKASFSPDEIRLLKILMEQFVDPRTGLVARIRYAHSFWGGQGIEELQQLMSEQTPNQKGGNDVDVPVLLSLLRKKEILENVSVEGKWSPLVVLRVGWLYTYLRENRINI